MLTTSDQLANSVSVGAATHAGLVRSTNEDRIHASPGMYLVADGMGGQAAGAVASQLAIETFDTLDAQRHAPADIHATAERAHRRVLAHAARHPEASGMGTTLAGLALMPTPAPHWVAFNIGDSRVYAFHGGHLRQLTTDHSEAEELVAAGRLTRTEARSHPARHVITRALGGPTPPRADLLVLPAGSGSRYVVCSDGLTTEVDDDDIAATLAGHHPAQSTADTLIRLALAGGGRDNVSVIVVDEPASWSPRSIHRSTHPRSRP